MLSCCGTLAKLATCPTAVGSPSLKVRKGERKEAKRVGSLEVWTLSPQQVKPCLMDTPQQPTPMI